MPSLPIGVMRIQTDWLAYRVAKVESLIIQRLHLKLLIDNVSLFGRQFNSLRSVGLGLIYFTQPRRSHHQPTVEQRKFTILIKSNQVRLKLLCQYQMLIGCLVFTDAKLGQTPE